jgi:recombination protein RecT
MENKKSELQIIKKEFAAIKPRFVDLTDEETFIKECSFALQHFGKNSYLDKSTMPSKLEAVMNVAMIGLTLNPVLKLAYLVPRRKGSNVVCHLEPSYQGLVKLITDTGSAKTIYAHVVHEGDDFEVSFGTSTEIKHTPKFKSKEIEFAYAVAILQDGTKQVDVMPRNELDEIRGTSESYKAWQKNNNIPCIWNTYHGEMCRKTVIKRLCKYLPKTDHWEKISTAIDLTDQDFKCSVTQMSIIEGLLVTANMLDSDKAAIDCDLESMSYQAAQKTIAYLEANQLDPLTHTGKASQTDIVDKLGEHCGPNSE